MHKNFIDYGGRPIDQSRLAEIGDYYARVYDEADDLVRVERYQQHKLADIKYYLEKTTERDIMESHMGAFPGMPFQISERSHLSPDGEHVVRTRFFDESGRLVETTAFEFGHDGLPYKSTHFDIHGRVNKYIRYHYDGDGELDYEFNYHPDGKFCDGFDFRRDESFVSLARVALPDAEKFRTAS